jgi:hypothetical protein
MSRKANQSDPPSREWYLATDGRKSGPLSEDLLMELIRQGKVSHTSLVWTKPMSSWQPVLMSKFAELVRDPTAPPPLAITSVNNTLVWILACAPIIGIFIERGIIMYSNTTFPLWWITVVLNITLVYLDESQLKSSGHDTSALGPVFLIPIYLYRRRTILKHPLGYDFLWVISFGLCTLFSIY